MFIKRILKHEVVPMEEAAKEEITNMFADWQYRSIPMTPELLRRKEEEELCELFNVKRPKRATIINRGERNLTGVRGERIFPGVGGTHNMFRYTCEFDADQAEMINRWTADIQGRVSRDEILRIVNFYTAIVSLEFKEVCEDIKNKISLMTDEEWNDCANRIPFDVPYTSDAIIRNPADVTIENWENIENWDEESQWGDETE